MSNNSNWITCIDHPKFLEFAKLLAKTKIKGKGEFYIHRDMIDNDTYLMACTRYGNSFVYYKLNLKNQSTELAPGRDITPPYPNQLDS